MIDFLLDVVFGPFWSVLKPVLMPVVMGAGLVLTTLWGGRQRSKRKAAEKRVDSLLKDKERDHDAETSDDQRLHDILTGKH